MSERIVIWSGGYDSTLCLWNELSKNKCVEVWSFDWECIGSIKTKCEFKVMRKFKVKVKRKGWKINHKIIKLNHSKITPEGNCVMQAAMFLPLVNYLAPSDSVVIWGFHWKDDYWSYNDRFCKIKDDQNNLMNKNVKYEFPLIGMKKWQIVDDIKRLNLENCVWTCERPLGILKPCGVCDPCINYKLALYEKRIRKPEGAKLIINGYDDEKVCLKDAEVV